MSEHLKKTGQAKDFEGMKAEREAKVRAELVANGEAVIKIPLSTKSMAADHLHPNPWQAREDFALVGSLATKLLAKGQMTPIDVRPHPEKPGEYQIMDGETRVRALKHNLERFADYPNSVPYVVARVRNHSDEDMQAGPIQTSEGRKSLNRFELGKSLLRLKEQMGPGATWDQVTERVGMSEGEVRNAIRPFREPADLVALYKEHYSHGFTGDHVVILGKLKGTEARDHWRKVLTNEVLSEVIAWQSAPANGRECPSPLSSKETRYRRDLLEMLLADGNLHETPEVRDEFCHVVVAGKAHYNGIVELLARAAAASEEKRAALFKAKLEECKAPEPDPEPAKGKRRSAETPFDVMSRLFSALDAERQAKLIASARKMLAALGDAGAPSL